MIKKTCFLWSRSIIYKNKKDKYTDETPHQDKARNKQDFLQISNQISLVLACNVASNQPLKAPLSTGMSKLDLHV